MRTDHQLDLHGRYCAERNWRTSLVLFLLAVYLGIVFWSHVSSPLPAKWDLVLSLFIFPLCALALAWLMVIFKCRRERLIYGLGMLALFLDFVMKALPKFTRPYTLTIRGISVCALVVVAILSLSLLYSAVRSRSNG